MSIVFKKDGNHLKTGIANFKDAGLRQSPKHIVHAIFTGNLTGCHIGAVYSKSSGILFMVTGSNGI